MIKKVINLVFGLFFALFITACSSELQPISSDKATTDYHSQISDLLRKLPPPKKPIIVAIYKFRDQSLFGVFDDVAVGQVIKLIDTVNHNALVDKKIAM